MLPQVIQGRRVREEDEGGDVPVQKTHSSSMPVPVHPHPSWGLANQPVCAGRAAECAANAVCQ